MIALAHQLHQSKIIDFPPTAVGQGKNNEWYTPSRYIEATRAVMGSIDLDPASCELANRTVKAKRYFTERDNGLVQEWNGNVWLNPPYGHTNNGHMRGLSSSLQAKFIEKLLREPVEQAVLLLLGNAVFNRYFPPLWDYPICFLDGSIDFHRPNGKVDKFGFGTIFVYLGPNEQRFIDIFQQFGTIAKRVSTPRHIIATPSLWEVQS